MKKIYKALSAVVRGRVIRSANASEIFEILKGDIDKQKLTLFSMFKDEIFFCKAFFEHYRSLGVEQFVIVDDGSTDGTLDFLLRQDDCVVLSSRLGFNTLYLTHLGLEKPRLRSGSVCLKTIVPRFVSEENYVLYVDADEFLVLPSPFSRLKDLYDDLERNGDTNVVAAVVEMFPEKLSDLEGLATGNPSSLEALISESPFFEAKPMIRLTEDGGYKMTASTKTLDLLNIHVGLEGLSASAKSASNSVRHKTPVMCHRPGNHRVDSHTATMPVSSRIVVGLLHFVYTRNLMGKLDRVAVWKTYAHSNAKYDVMTKLLSILREEGSSLLTAQSCRFSENKDLERAGIIFAKTQGTSGKPRALARVRTH